MVTICTIIGMVLLTNYEEFDTLNQTKPTYLCYFHSGFFSRMEVKMAGYKQPSDLSVELKTKMHLQNNSLDRATFQINISKIYPTLKAFQARIQRIEITLGYIVKEFRVLRIFQIIVHFADSQFVIEMPVQFLDNDELEQMEVIREYLDSPSHLDIFTLKLDVIEYLQKYNKNDLLEMHLSSSIVSVTPKANSQNINLELNRGLLNDYRFADFKQHYPSYNCFTLMPNILHSFSGHQVKLSISKETINKCRIFIQQQIEDKQSIILKSISGLSNKMSQLLIQDDEDDIDEIVQQLFGDETPQFGQLEPQLEKKTKL